MTQGVSVFCYPEELEHVSPAKLAEQLLRIADGVSLAVVYHRARRILPRHHAVSVLAGSGVYFEPDRARYGALVPRRTAAPKLAEQVLRFREACDTAGLRFRAWVVALHHDRLAAERPGAASLLLDGSPAGHGLCPSSVETIEFAASLASDVAARLGPEAVDLEAAWYPAWEPSYTLTLSLEPLGERARLLGSQCFCTSCRTLLGPRAASLEARARAAAGPPFGDEASGDDQIAGELSAMRATGAARLVEAVAGAVHGQGARLRLFASGAPGQAALQGVSEPASAAADDLLFGCGPLAGDELTARFTALSACAGRTGAASLNWTPERSPAAFAADVERVVTAGADGLALYNLSLVPDAGLEAFRAASLAYRAAVPA